MLEQLGRMLGDSPRDDRDRAVLLVGFAGAFRSFELAVMRSGRARERASDSPNATRN